MLSRVQFILGLVAGLFGGLFAVIPFVDRSMQGDNRLAISLAATCGFLAGNGAVYLIAQQISSAFRKEEARASARKQAKWDQVFPAATQHAIPVATGRACVACQQRILMLTDGTSCRRCDAAYHHTCRVEGGCPKCGGPPPLPANEVDSASVD